MPQDAGRSFAGAPIFVVVMLALPALVPILAETRGVAVAPLLVLMLIVTAAARRRRALVAPAAPAAVAVPDTGWRGARTRFDALRSAYAAYECDPREVLRLPALADVTVPSTARFVDAYAEAQALDTDVRPGAEHAAAFVTAVGHAERAWQAARDAAERIRLSALSPAERASVDRIVKLLTTARESDSEPERLAAYARARSELEKLDRAGTVHLPRAAAAALEAASRRELPS